MIVDVVFESSTGERIGLFKPPYHLYDTEGLFGSVQSENQLSTVPSLNGSRYYGSRLENREVTLYVDIRKQRSRGLSRLRQNLTRICNPLSGMGKLYVSTFEDGDFATYFLDCFADGFPEILDNKNTPDKQRAIIRLVAPSPSWKSEQVVSEPLFEGLFKFPFSGPFKMGISRDRRVIEYDGDEPCGVVIKFNGYALNPKIINGATGEYIKVNAEILEGQILEINTDLREKSVKIYTEGQDDGIDAFDLIDLGSTFFQLQVGENEITYTADDTYQSAISSISYYKLYSSI